MNLFKSKTNSLNFNEFNEMQSTVTLKHFPNSTREWNNNIYAYNKNGLSLIPSASLSASKIIKSYFSLFNLNLEKKLRTKKLFMRRRKLSKNKIYIGNSEFKHTNHKVVINLYVFNRQKKSYFLNIKKKFNNKIKRNKYSLGYKYNEKRIGLNTYKHNKFLYKKKNENRKWRKFNKDISKNNNGKIMNRTYKRMLYKKHKRLNNRISEIHVKEIKGTYEKRMNWKTFSKRISKNNVKEIKRTYKKRFLKKRFFKKYKSRLKKKEKLNWKIYNKRLYKRIKHLIYKFNLLSKEHKKNKYIMLILMKNNSFILNSLLNKRSYTRLPNSSFIKRKGFRFMKQTFNNNILLNKPSNILPNISSKKLYNKFEDLFIEFKSKVNNKLLFKLRLYFYYRQLIYINKSKFNYTYLQILKRYLELIYNKRVEFNLINLKRFYLNSNILSESIKLKLTKNRRRIFKYLSTLKNKVKVKKKNVRLLKQTPMLGKDLNKFAIQKTIVKNIKYKEVTGYRLEAKGRLGRRHTASRSVSKINYKGNLLDLDSSHRGLSTVLLKGNLKSNLQYTKLKSKTRTGSFGLKGWVSGY